MPFPLSELDLVVRSQWSDLLEVETLNPKMSVQQPAFRFEK